MSQSVAAPFPANGVAQGQEGDAAEADDNHDETTRAQIASLLELLPTGLTTEGDVAHSLASVKRHAELSWATGYCTQVPHTVDTETAARNQIKWLVQQFESYVEACAKQNGRKDAAQDAFMWAIIGAAGVLETARSFGMPIAEGAKGRWEAHIASEVRKLGAGSKKKKPITRHGSQAEQAAQRTSHQASNAASPPPLSPASHTPAPPIPITILRTTRMGRTRERAAWRLRKVAVG
jgi:hypothetical protein